MEASVRSSLLGDTVCYYVYRERAPFGKGYLWTDGTWNPSAAQGWWKTEAEAQAALDAAMAREEVEQTTVEMIESGRLFYLVRRETPKGTLYLCKDGTWQVSTENGWWASWAEAQAALTAVQAKEAAELATKETD